MLFLQQLFHKHKWSEWENLENCRQKRRCLDPDCDQEDLRDHHELTPWADVEGKCEQVRHCLNCPYEEKREISHSFSDYEYYIPGCCTQRRVCARCTFVERRDKCDWSPEKYTLAMGRCATVTQCRRCGDMKYGTAEHEWLADAKNHAGCLTYRKNRNQQMLANVESQIALYQNIQMTQSTSYHKLIAQRNELQEQISHDECLLQDKVLGAKEARICKKCLFVQRVDSRSNPEREKARSVFISYSHAYEVSQVLALKQKLTEEGFLVTFDQTDLYAGDSISTFVESIREHDCVLFVISNPYIKSFWCMSEATTFMQEQNYKTRMLPILGDDACMKIQNHNEYETWWNDTVRKEWRGLSQDDNVMCRKIAAGLQDFLKVVVMNKAAEISDYRSIIHWINHVNHSR